MSRFMGRPGMPEGAHAELVDATSSRALFGVMGPRFTELAHASSPESDNRHLLTLT